MRFLCATLFCAAATCLLGCSSDGPKAPPTAPVKGAVSLDGKPMGGGEVRFTAPGELVKTIEIKDGQFAGEAFVGKNRVEVVWDKDGPPNPTDPTTKMKVNAVSNRFLGPNSPFQFDIPAGGKSDFKLDVTSARK
jgi:hypothetical protein